MSKKTIIMAAVAFLITLAATMLIGSCNKKAEAKDKREKVESKADEGSRTEVIIGKPLAGFSEVLDRAWKKNCKLLKKLFKQMQEEKEAKEQLQADINLLAEVIYHENWYTDKDKLTAYWTGAVVMNRVNSDEWPNTIYDVLYQKGQYSTTKKFYTVELPKEVYEMAEDIIVNGTPDVPERVVFQATFRQGKVWKVLNGEYFCYG